MMEECKWNEKKISRKQLIKTIIRIGYDYGIKRPTVQKECLRNRPMQIWAFRIKVVFQIDSNDEPIYRMKITVQPVEKKINPHIKH